MKNNKMLYVVSAPNENHFFFTSQEAWEDFRCGKAEMKYQRETGEIAIYRGKPLLDEEGKIDDCDKSMNKYFQASRVTDFDKLLSKIL